MIYFAIEFKDKKYKDAYMSGDADARFNIRSLHFANKKIMLKYRWFDEADALIYEVRSPYSAGVEILQLISRLGLGAPVAGKVRGGIVKTGTTNIKDREGFISNFLSEDFLQEDYVAIPIVGRIEQYGGPFFFYKKDEVIKDRFRLSTGNGAPFEQIILTPSRRSGSEIKQREDEKQKMRKDALLRQAPFLDMEERGDVDEQGGEPIDKSKTPDIQRAPKDQVDWETKSSDVVTLPKIGNMRIDSPHSANDIINTARLSDRELASIDSLHDKRENNTTTDVSETRQATGAGQERELASIPNSGQVQTAGIGGLSNNATAAAVLGAILTGAIAHSIEKKSVKDIRDTIDQKFPGDLRVSEVIPIPASEDDDEGGLVSRPSRMSNADGSTSRWHILRGASVFDLDR